MTSVGLPPDRPLPHVPGVRHDTVQVRDTRLHVAQAGDGPPVLLLHGFPQHWYAWRHLIPLLAGDHRLICPDLRGFGWSAPARGGFGTRDRAADVIALLDRLGLEQVGLVGHDWGAWTGFSSCLQQPERFSRFVALNMMHPWPRQGGLITQAWRFWYTAVIEYPVLGRLALQHWPAFTRFLLRRGVADRRSWEPDEIEEYVAAAGTPSAARAGQGLHWGFVTQDIPDLVRGRYRQARLTVPTLLLAGERDIVIPPGMLTGPGHADGPDRAAPEIRVEVVAGAGHHLPQERPELVALRIREHLAG